MSPKLYSYLFAQQADSFSFQKTPVHLSARVFSYVKRVLILPPAFMRGVPEGRGESEYLHSKYSKMPTFL